MPTFYSDEGTKQNSVIGSSTAATGGAGARTENHQDIGGGLKAAKVVYTFGGTEVNDDIVKLLWLPAGATVIPELSFISTTGGPDSLDVGVGADDDVFFATKDVGGSGQFDFANDVEKANYTITNNADGGDWVQAVIEDITDITANDTMTALIVYIV